MEDASTLPDPTVVSVTPVEGEVIQPNSQFFLDLKQPF